MTRPEDHPLARAAIAIACERHKLTETQARAVLMARYRLLSAPEAVAKGLPSLAEYADMVSFVRYEAARRAGDDSWRQLLSDLDNAAEISDQMLLAAVNELTMLAKEAATALNNRLQIYADRSGRPLAEVRRDFQRLYHEAAGLPRGEEPMPDDMTDWLAGAPPDHTVDVLLTLSRRESLLQRDASGQQRCVVCGAVSTALHSCGAEFERDLAPCPPNPPPAELVTPEYLIRMPEPTWFTTQLDAADRPLLFPVSVRVTPDSVPPLQRGAPPLADVLTGQLAVAIADSGGKALVRPMTLRCTCDTYGQVYSCQHLAHAVQVVQQSLSTALADRNSKIGVAADQYRQQRVAQLVARERIAPQLVSLRPAGYLHDMDAFAEDWHNAIASLLETGIAVPFRSEGLTDTSGTPHGMEVEFQLATPRDPRLSELRSGRHDERLDAIASELGKRGLLAKPYGGGFWAKPQV